MAYKFIDYKESFQQALFRYNQAQDKDLLVAQSLWFCNVKAREWGTGRYLKDHLYAYKRLIIRILYEKGYCTRVTRHMQRMECWGCDGEGYTSHRYSQTSPVRKSRCDRCYGTGIHAEYQLHLFKFSIGGKFFNWHQPSGFADWLQEETDLEADYEEPKYSANSELYPVDNLQVSYYIMHLYLIRHYVSPLSLLGCESTLDRIRHGIAVAKNFQQHRQYLQTKYRKLRSYIRRLHRRQEFNDIPF